MPPFLFGHVPILQSGTLIYDGNLAPAHARRTPTMRT